MRAAIASALLMVLSPTFLGSGNGVAARNTQSVIESVTPAFPAGVTIDVVGFDAFLRLRSDGHEVEVPGYSKEPYIRITRTGEVFVNTGSVTAVLNDDRYGGSLAGFTESATPRWEKTGSNGTILWHDHRSHWMSPKPPAPIDDEGRVQDFVVTVVVDGVESKVRGTMFLRPSASPAWWLFGVFGLVGLLLVALRRSPPMWVAVGIASVAGLAVGTMQWAGLPSGARITPTLATFSLLALVSTAVGVVLGRSRPHLSPVMNVGAAVSLLTATWLCSDQVRAAYIPGPGLEWLSRMTIPTLLGVGIVVLIDGLMGVLRGAGAQTDSRSRAPVSDEG